MIAFAAIAVLLLCVFAGIRWPGVALAGAVFTFQVRAISAMDWPPTLYVPLMMGVLLFNAARRRNENVNTLDLMYIIWIGWYCSTFTYMDSVEVGATAAVALLLSASTMFLAGRLAIGSTDFRSLVRQMSIAFVVVGGVLALLILLTGNSQARTYLGSGAGAEEAARAVRFTVNGASAVGVAQPLPLCLIAAIVLSINALISKRYAWLVIYVPCAAVLADLALVNATRGTFIAVIGGMVAYAFYMRKQRGILAILAVGGVAGLFFVSQLPLRSSGIALGVTRVFANFLGPRTGVDASGVARLVNYRAALRLFTDNPMLGAGIGGFDYHTGLMYPHNMVLEIASEYGTIGIVLCVSVFIALIYRFRRADIISIGWEGPLFASLIIAVLVQQQVSLSLFMAKGLFLMVGLVAGLPVVRKIQVSAQARHRITPRFQARPSPG